MAHFMSIYLYPKAAAEFVDKLGYSSKQFARLCLQDMLKQTLV